MAQFDGQERRCDWKQAGLGIRSISLFLGVIAGFVAFIYYLTTRPAGNAFGAEQDAAHLRGEEVDPGLSGLNVSEDAVKQSEGLLWS